MSASPRRAGLTRAALLLVLLAPLLSALLGPLRRASPLLHIGVPCDHAVELDGVLRCGDGAPRTLAELCPSRQPAGPQGGSARLRSGDSVATSALCALSTPQSGGPHWSRMRPEHLAALAVPVNLNRASQAELASLPGVGPVLAERITAARPFTSVVDLLDVRGIGPVKFSRIEQRGRVDGELP